MTEFITQDITYPCSYDLSEQPARVLQATRPGRPLLVYLHAWSWGYRQPEPQELSRWCDRHDWNLILPHFRGPSWNPQSCGHEAAVQDIADAVAHAIRTYQADPANVFLCGCSGGGFHTLLMAGRHPHLWKGVSAWVPIADLVAWHRQPAAIQAGYAAHIESVCGGNPQSDSAAAANAVHRSPLTYLEPNLPCVIDINAGIHDGHSGPVPVSHALHAFNACVLPEERIPQEDIDAMTDGEAVPSRLRLQDDLPGFGDHHALYRRQADQTTVTLFEGGHEIVPTAVIAWLERLA